MKFIWTITAFVAVTVMAMPHGAHETREPSVYVRAPEPGCIKRTPNCGYTYIKRSEATEEVKDEDTYLKGKVTASHP
ncbi:hypothetical protein MGU_07135 [Metarhizium guizhouense ARSEF 977]|uniref:Uncharacterized protein n=1 Tax=Metarhizium guizhouense (strain ARSEF 977) TaxID=1276136 RepID=A0A0B4GSI9_METGA|nr:hypothetical protein MGU_07135 [Metarhizium guizhouense ARSEF 977]